MLPVASPQVRPPSVERRTQWPSHLRRSASVILAMCARHWFAASGLYSGSCSKASDVNQLITSVPLPVTTSPASRSSSGVLLMVTGADQVLPPSALRTSWVLPKGQTCA